MDFRDRHASVTRAALGGATGRAVGMTFIAEEALTSLRWGTSHPPAVLAEACDRMALDFVFVPSWEVWSDEASDRVASVGTDVLWVVPGPFGVLAELDGWSETLRRSFAEPESLEADLDALMPSAAEAVRRGARLGVAGIVVAEDLAGAEGPIVAPDYALECIIPRAGRIAAAAAEESLPAVFHSDGDMRAFLGGLRAAGFVAVHPGGLDSPGFERLFEAAHDAGLAVIGGITGDALRAGTPAAISSAGRVAVLAARGGLLIADDGGIATGDELAALIAALEFVQEDV